MSSEFGFQYEFLEKSRTVKITTDAELAVKIAINRSLLSVQG